MRQKIIHVTRSHYNMRGKVCQVELIIDNFAGGGGASTGIEMATGRSVDIAINHDYDAIAMHRANHPNTRHYCEDVWQVDPVEACSGNQVGLAWFSPDCTHFSRAKGGKPVDKNIRGLAWVTIRWALKVRPRVIMLENVPEIRTWGPLGADNKPIKERAGETFDGFIKALTAGIPHDHPAFAEMCATLEISPDSTEAAKLEQGLGYNAEYRILRSCDYGAPTTRTRFYLIARCDGKPIVFPPPTHGNGKGLKPYHTAAECIDWSIPAQSIFERDKPLAENTLRRIARGIEKFVINNPEPFIVTVNHSGEGFRGQKADEPLGTITAKNGYGVVTPTIMCNNTGNAGAAVDTPLPTVTTGNRNYMVAPSLIQYHSETANDEVRGQELSEPLMTVDTSPRYALSVAHIMKNYGGNYQGAGSGADKPLDTVTAHDHNSLVTAHILTMRNNMDGQPADEPLATITAGGSHHAEVQAFLVKYFSNGTPKPVNSPLDTVTTKDRFALVTIHGEEYIITDIKMRMLQPRELFNAQGFPEDYIIDHDDSGKPYPKSKQTARCGNAVTPPVPAALVRANLPEMCGLGDGGEQE
nr:MAG TPA: DNA cytosine methyltransferase [Caudoviricetes sp.]DAY52355.1 MAG TPA: DNA cytosine methyltransferase [Caudoviricetes sp.]DAY82452.1 MAG TPA: DNA cytosine methyltransferase [Caudoviricetes sp.]